jgi:hypothetical protein
LTAEALQIAATPLLPLIGVRVRVRVRVKVCVRVGAWVRIRVRVQVTVVQSIKRHLNLIEHVPKQRKRE